LKTFSNETYSIQELSELTEIKERTIRHYIREGIVSSPTKYATFGPKHLLELQVIKILHGRGIKLSGIKGALQDKTEEELRTILTGSETDSRFWDVASIKNIAQAEAPSDAAPSFSSFSFATIGTKKPAHAPQPSGILSMLSTTQASDSETWQRLRPIEGVEIHIRDDVDPKTKDLVMQLVKQLRK
jgi:DNA-binding transcriptional MerR regulator